MKVVRGSLNSEPFQSMSSSREFLCAVSQRPNIVVATVDSKIKEILTFAPLSASGNYAITDIAWSCTNFGQLAVSSTNGNLSVFDMESSILQKSVSNPKSIWNGTVTARSVHKICWHEDKLSTLATANQDGIIRIFDTRSAGQTNHSGTIICQEFSPKCDAIRDVHFNPFNAYQFAAISENGTLTVWDRRQTDSGIMTFLAHTSSGLSISYHPHKENIIATGGIDKYLKIWDLSSNSNNNNNNEIDDINKLSGVNTSNINTSGSFALHNNPLKPVFSVRTPGQVNSLQWRGKHHAIVDTSSPQHSLFGSQIATASIERSEVLVWNLNYPHLPACVLAGHGDVCTDFRWIDTPRDSSATAVQNFQDADANTLDVNQHILSIGKDGKMLLQDLRNAYFPRQHIFTNIVALSSTGDVAFHRGNVSKLDLLGLVTNEATANSNTLFKDEPHNFGMDFSLKSPNKNIYYINSALSIHQQNMVKINNNNIGNISSISNNSILGSGGSMTTTGVGGGVVTNSSTRGSLASSKASITAVDHNMIKSQKSSKLALSSSLECMNNMNNINNLSINTTTTASASSYSPLSTAHTLDNISSSPLTPNRKFLRQNGVISLSLTATANNNNIRRSRDASNTSSNDNSLHNCSHSSTVAGASAAAVTAARERRMSEEDVQLANANAMFRSFFSGYDSLERREAIEILNNNNISANNSSRNLSNNHSRTSSSLTPSASHKDIKIIEDATYTTTSNTRTHNNHDNDNDNSLVSINNNEQLPSAKVLTLIQNSTCSLNGMVFVGMTNIDSLLTAKLIRKEKNGAEGRKFDPAVIKLLAAEYTLGGEGQGYKKCSPKESCTHNVAVAEKAGFLCRAALFRTILTLFPIIEVSATASNNINNITEDRTASNIATASSTTTTATTNNNSSNINTDTATAITTTATTDDGSLPFATELIGEVLSDLLEVGDCQHFVIVCEILLRISKLFLDKCLKQANIISTRRLEAYYSYIELLRRFKQFSKANEIIMQTDIANKTVLNQYGVLMHISCSHCGKELPDRISMPWCQKCHKNVGICVICHEPVSGLFRWCAVCGHGGHSECTRQWFHNCHYMTCPSGCGHDCNALNHFD